MSIEMVFSLTRGSFSLDVSLSAPAGEVTAVLGPNGAGKSSLLGALAGTVPIDAGSIVLDGIVLDEPPKTFVPPDRRNLGHVRQDHLLFPHLTAVENVAFGPRAKGQRPAEARAVALGLLERLGVGEQAGLKPAQMSGGQAQRVALARALAVEPAALLLDEPLAALDAGTRIEVRRDLRRHLAGFAGPTVLVTHDPVDALTLADRVAILEAGRVTQAGTLAEVTSRPRSRYVADLIGTNLLSASASGALLRSRTGLSVTTAEEHHGEVFATIAPAAVALHRHEPEGSPRNRWESTVVDLDMLGDRVRVRLSPPVDMVAEVTPAAIAELGLHEGQPIWASVKATEVVTYPA